MIDVRQIQTRHLTTSIELVLAGTIISLAVWTSVFQVALHFRWPLRVSAAVFAVALLTCLVLLWRRRSSVAADAPAQLLAGATSRPTRLERLGLLSLAGAVLISVWGWAEVVPQWWLVWLLVVVGLLAAITASMKTRPLPAIPPVGHPSAAAVGSVLMLAASFGALSAMTNRPDADDVFLVNRSTWVEQRGGPFPHRDTIFSDEVFRVTRPPFPQTAIEPLVGLIARATPWTSPTMTYLVLGPAAAALSILAMWRLLRTLGAPAPAIATWLAAGFIVLDGAQRSGFGNLSFGRSWQGKVIFLTVVIPLIHHYGLQWARSGRRVHLALLTACGLAGLGLTSTALFVVPAAVLVSVAAGALACRSASRFAWGAAATLPVIAVALIRTRVPSQPLVSDGMLATIRVSFVDFTPDLPPPYVWHNVMGTGLGLLVGMVAITTAWMFTRERSGRLLLLLGPLALFGFFYGPGTIDRLAAATGTGSILWRVIWIVPLPAMVGLVLSGPLVLTGRARRPLSILVPCAALAMMLSTSMPVLDARNAGATFGRPSWDLDRSSLSAARQILDLSEPGAMTLAPVAVGGTIAILTTQVRTVTPRERYIDSLARDPSFLADDRRLVTSAVEQGVPPEAIGEFVDALERLNVSVVCARPWVEISPVGPILKTAGFEQVRSDENCEYWVRR